MTLDKNFAVRSFMAYRESASIITKAHYRADFFGPTIISAVMTVQGILFQYDYLTEHGKFCLHLFKPFHRTDKLWKWQFLTSSPINLPMFYKDSLPKISSSWWTSLVIEKLTFQQQYFARQYNPNSLEQIDLAALLLLIYQNWYDLSQQLNLDKTARNWLKEALTIRNPWEYAPLGRLDYETRYRAKYHWKIATEIHYRSRQARTIAPQVETES